MKWNVKTVFLPLCTAAFTVMAASGANAVLSTPEVENFGISGTSSLIREIGDFNGAELELGDAVTSDGSTTLTFDLFDGALGTLNNVLVEINSSTVAELVLEGAEGGVSESDHTLTVNSTTLGAANLTGSLAASCTGFNCNDTVQSPGPVAGNLFTIFSLGAPVLANFIGTGEFDIDVGALAELTQCISGTSANSEPPRSCEATTNWSVSITVTYDFKAAVVDDTNRVPEPAALGLLGVGLVGLGALSRRRRKAGADA